MKLIDKIKLLEELKKLKQNLSASPIVVIEDVESLVESLEEKDVDDELQGLEKEVAEDGVNAIDRKRIPIVLKGEIKAKFKNEFNTLWQTVHGIQFANVAKHIIERLCLHFAAWGVYNLKDYCSISSEEKHKMDIEVKEDGDNYLEKFKSLRHITADLHKTLEDWGYAPNLYFFDGSWHVDWISCEEGDSIKCCTADTAEEAINKAYNWFHSTFL